MIDQFYEQLYLIRAFEKKIEELFHQGSLFGTTHACIGQEAIAVGAINALAKDDFIISNHRCHGHYIAYSNNPEGLMAEIMGKETGVVGGRGGSQHLQDKRFYSNGIQGGMVPVAAGLALGEKLKKTENIVTCFIGDGTLGQGVVYESLNLASLWKLPVLFIVENNFYAMSTHIQDAAAGTLVGRGRAFDVDSFEISTNDVEEVYNIVVDHSAMVREKKKPVFLVFNTYRQCGHSKSDDRCYRSRKEEEQWLHQDPILILEEKIYDRDKIALLKEKVSKRIEAAYIKAKEAGFPVLGA